MEAPGQLPSLPSPKSGADFSSIDYIIACAAVCSEFRGRYKVHEYFL